MSRLYLDDWGDEVLALPRKYAPASTALGRAHKPGDGSARWATTVGAVTVGHRTKAAATKDLRERAAAVNLLAPTAADIASARRALDEGATDDHTAYVHALGWIEGSLNHAAEAEAEGDDLNRDRSIRSARAMVVALGEWRGAQ